MTMICRFPRPPFLRVEGEAVVLPEVFTLCSLRQALCDMG